MADVASDIDGKVTTDSTGSRVQGVRSTEQDTTGPDRVLALEDDADDGTGSHVLDETGEELLALEIGIMLFQVLFGSVNHFESGDLVTASFETSDDGADEVTLHAVGLDHDVGCASKLGRRNKDQVSISNWFQEQRWMSLTLFSGHFEKSICLGWTRPRLNG